MQSDGLSYLTPNRMKYATGCLSWGGVSATECLLWGGVSATECLSWGGVSATDLQNT